MIQELASGLSFDKLRTRVGAYRWVAVPPRFPPGIQGKQICIPPLFHGREP